MKRGVSPWVAWPVVFGASGTAAMLGVTAAAFHRTLASALLGGWPPIAYALGSVAALALGLRFFRTAHRLKQKRQEALDQGRCQWCGYDLRATRGRCPECGKLIPPGTPARLAAEGRMR